MNRTTASNNPNWNGGTSKEPYPFHWPTVRRIVLDRDGGQCLNPLCRRMSSKVHVHHIDYDKNNCAPSNLITICDSCNARANFGRDAWMRFYQHRQVRRGLAA